jgi:hypothetical protein
MKKLFANFPKKRINLPDKYKEIYHKHYKLNREGKTLATSASAFMESWMHRKTAKDVCKHEKKSTLEIGAGTLNHLKYEVPEHYDIVEPFFELFENSTHYNLIDNIYTDINQIEEIKKYDRIISIATFEHITDLPFVVYKTCKLLEKNGTLRVAIPNEGSLIWELGWKVTTGFEYKLKYGLDYSQLMKYEHVNTADEIEDVLKFFYQNVECSFSGLIKSLSFYRFFICSFPDTQNVNKYLSELTD